MMKKTASQIEATAFPEDTATSNLRSYIFAEAGNAAGRHVASVLETGEGYTATAAASVHVMQQLLTQHLVGALIPAQAFGSRFALTLPDTHIFDEASFTAISDSTRVRGSK
jgi:short subunit dehydrogenase-like uncharacterized protein